MNLTCSGLGLDIAVNLQATDASFHQNAPDRKHSHPWMTSSIWMDGRTPDLVVSEDDNPNMLHFYAVGPKMQQDQSGFEGLVLLAQAYTGESSIGTVAQFFSTSELQIATPGKLLDRAALITIKVATSSPEVQSFRKSCTDLTDIPPKSSGENVDQEIMKARGVLGLRSKTYFDKSIALFQEGRGTHDLRKMRAGVYGIEAIDQDGYFRRAINEMKGLIDSMFPSGR